MMKTILVLAVHPDDETIGCGGTLLKLGQMGCELHWLIATSASTADGYSEKFVQARQTQIEQVGQAYAFTGIHRLKLPAARVETVPLGAIVGSLSSLFKQIAPDTLFLPFANDVHSDHRLLFDAAFSCAKSFRLPSLKHLYMMETLSETEFAPAIPGRTFTPNSFVDISAFFDNKLEILNIYQSEIAAHPFPRSPVNVTSLALHRGATAGCRYAESFMLLKEIW